MKQKKFTLSFWIRNEENGKEILEVVSCDNWTEWIDEEHREYLAKIYCFNNNSEKALGFPASSLRKIKQNFGLSRDVEITKQTMEQEFLDYDNGSNLAYG